MIKIFFGLLIGFVIGAVAVWYLQPTEHRGPVRSTLEEIESSARAARASIEEKLRAWNLDGARIKEEMERTGRVIREKSQEAGRVITEATADSRVTAAIKAKLVRDPDLSAWNISVDTTEGTVTLAGSVSSPEDVGKAMALAMETDGVKRVISTLQVKAREE
ncbi:MAG TPA: BON domain-containing protein [Verrucomicrobia bacterium]|nr:BON domain-containing protein [Verrucomicrobiota bacterium]HOB34096.1 BON domain-containing protein [Verrucomicrobiota bacterium]HOP96050.1 BON domain-containing protein [Verrucomicrobiota bacterium]HPU57408.1 BON domain-containing protein [Verrucomicrobiota bacterium]